jgi:biopolymer transport protein ExbB
MNTPWIRIAAVTLAPAAAWAQEPAAAQSMSMRQIIEYGGWLMYPLAALSVLAVAMIIYFVVVLRETNILPRKFIAGVRDLLESRRYAEAATACRANTSPLAVILGAAIEYRLHTAKPDTALLGEIVEGEGSRQATLIQNQIQYLVDIGAIAPMIGLLGTVMGMLKAFNTVALDLAKAKPILLAAGVSQALITTVAGLLVAIPAMLAYSYFRGRTAKIIANLETESADLVTLVARED